MICYLTEHELMTMAFPVKPGDTFSVPADDGWPASMHVFDAAVLNSISAAMLSKRPLLLSGERGVGKSQLARAIALVVNRPLLWHSASSEEADSQQISGHKLLWHMDSVLNRNHLSKDAMTPGVLWWAMSPKHAHKHSLSVSYWKPRVNTQKRLLRQGAVLLLEHIDQASKDYVHQLSSALERQAFHVPCLEQPEVQQDESIPSPICVMTCDDVDQVDARILKRCVLLPLQFPARESLIAIAKAHVDVDDSVCHAAIDRLMQARRVAAMRKQMGPGISELLDAIRVVQTLATQEPKQQIALLAVSGLDVIGLLSPFKYQKAKLVVDPITSV